MRPIFLAATIVLAMFSGCFGEEVESVQPSELTVVAPESVLRGQYFTIEVASDLDWTMNRSQDSISWMNTVCFEMMLR